MLVKTILIVALIGLSVQLRRNLQFTHFNPAYTSHLPTKQTYGAFPFLNPFDPYTYVSVSTGVGSNLNGQQFIVQCSFPLQFLNGACRCAYKGRFIDGNCFSEFGVNVQQEIQT